MLFDGILDEECKLKLLFHKYVITLFMYTIENVNLFIINVIFIPTIRELTFLHLTY